MFHERGDLCALAVLNPHHETRFSPHVAPFERHVSLGSAIDDYHPRRSSVTGIPFSQIRSPISINSAMQLTINLHGFHVSLMFRSEKKS